MEELDGLAEQQSVKPPAAARTGTQRQVEGNAHQAGADPRARQVLDEAVGDRFEDAGAAGAPQHCGVACVDGERGALGWLHTYNCFCSITSSLTRKCTALRSTFLVPPKSESYYLLSVSCLATRQSNQTKSG